MRDEDEEVHEELEVMEVPVQDGVMLLPVPVDTPEEERQKFRELAVRLAEDLRTRTDLE
ncbi:hypothetical protein [Spongiactinospora gelatinilytica]|uniref:hypothetical protein n=1 Tax=Spongiactinospora gelatinilytica TaxID=2666298 RepID=UPI001314FC35|nr:hypothetical protein [Spongiactinospora gelatinilytica]